MIDKEQCKRLYADLKRDLPDLDSITFRGHWYYRAECMKDAGCWRGYSRIIKEAKKYLAGEGEYPGYSKILRTYREGFIK